MPSFRCTDFGIVCPFEASAKTEDELIKKIAEHVAERHAIKTITPELVDKIKKAIKK